MEISATLKNDITNIQGEIAKAIHDHQNLALKLKEFPSLEIQIKQDLLGIQKHIVELNDKQKVLLQKLRKDIQDNISNGQFVPVFNFNLYSIKPGQLESKKRRRKDLSLAPKIMSCRPTHSPPSLSPSPTPTSSSSLSDDSIDYISPCMLPIPIPKARPMLLPDVKENVYLGSVSRRDLRPPKLKKNQKILSDEEVFKDIPVFYDDPLPSPPPTDEKDIQARFMAALSLIPKEMLHEILNRKVERKRRSTATNNPNFVYNNDWEIPAWKRSRTYLSPHKNGKIEASNKKIKSEDASEGVLSTKQNKKEKESECEKSGKVFLEDFKLPPGITLERVDTKSRNSTPDSTSSNMICFICHTSGLLNVCKDCSICYHLSCVSPNSSISCPCCKHKRSSPDEGSCEESIKEEFMSKCPNVAESYSKLKEYIENHTDSDTSALFSERENFKIELMAKNQELYSQKRDLEEKAAELSEALLLQEDYKNNLLKEEEKLLAKIKVIIEFVSLYQKTNPKNIKKEEDNTLEEAKTFKTEEDENSNVESNGEIEKELENCEIKKEEEIIEKEEKKFENFDDTCGSPSSWKESYKNSQNFHSPEQFSQESLGNSPRAYENFDSSSQMSKESMPNENSNIDNYESPPASSKQSAENPLFELDEGDEQLTSQSIECSAESEGVDYDSSIE